MKQFCHEPLVRFLVIGAALFGLYRFPANQAAPGTSKRINIAAGEIEQLRAVFMRQRQGGRIFVI